MSLAALPPAPAVVREGDAVTCLDSGQRGHVLAVRLPAAAETRPEAGDGKRYLVQLGGLARYYGRHEIAPAGEGGPAR